MACFGCTRTNFQGRCEQTRDSNSKQSYKVKGKQGLRAKPPPNQYVFFSKFVAFKEDGSRS
eukprot:3705987-Amphidinium_carterae.1